MARASLPPGFRFHPTDVELVMYYLKKKILGKKLLADAVTELNIYKYAPWDLPDKSCFRSKDLEWYFFCPKERKYLSGSRTNRATEIGYWKSTGKDRPVHYKEQIVGMVKTLVFHKGHAPKGERTDWVIHEYRLQVKELADRGVVQDVYVLCKVFQKTGPGPKVGAQYGAPFNEEDWDDSSVTCVPASISSVSEPGSSRIPPVAEEVPPPVSDKDEDILSLFDMFTVDGTILADDDGNEKGLQAKSLVHEGISEDLNFSDGNEIYNGLEDLENWEKLRDGQLICMTEYGVNMGQDVAYLELNDLRYPLNYPIDSFGSENLLSDGLCEAFGNKYSEQSYSQTNSFDAAQQVTTMNQLSLPSADSTIIDNHFDVFQGNGAKESIDPECAAYCNENLEQLELRHPLQEQNRGEHQRNSYSRLQQLLESIPARPASAAERLAPTKESSIFFPYDGSSFNVKAEVTCADGCTKDALSEMLGESTWYCQGNHPRMEFGAKAIRCDSGFAFFFLVSLISFAIWIFLDALLVRLGPFCWMNLCFNYA